MTDKIHNIYLGNFNTSNVSLRQYMRKEDDNQPQNPIECISKPQKRKTAETAEMKDV